MSFKIFLGLITSKGERQNIEELTSVYDSFDGLAAVFSGEKDEGYDILESRKKDGFVINPEWYYNHSFAMNHFLLHPKIVPGRDWILLRDSTERVNPEFASNLRNIIHELENNNINSVFNYSKLLLFKRFENQIFQFSPHWSCVGLRQGYLALEQQGGVFSDEKNYCFSTRGQNRPKDHWVKHFLKYYAEYPDSNHLLLGRENDQSELPKLEAQRQAFRLICFEKYKLQFPKADDIIDYWRNNVLDNEDKSYINNELILNGAYRYFVLGVPLEEIAALANNKQTVDI